MHLPACRQAVTCCILSEGRESDERVGAERVDKPACSVACIFTVTTTGEGRDCNDRKYECVIPRRDFEIHLRSS